MKTGLRPYRPANHRIVEGPHGETVCKPAPGDEFPSAENVAILESWNTVRDPGLSVARARLAPGEATEPHCLDQTTERYLVVAGSGTVRIGALGPVDVGPGDVVFIPPGISQHVANSGDGDLIFYCLCTPAFDESDYRPVVDPALDQGDD